MTQTPPRAYKNPEFINSSGARPLRILSEYLEPAERLAREKIEHTVVFFGSARTRSEGPDPHDTHRYYHVAEETAYQLCKWVEETPDIRDSMAICTGGGPGIMEAANRGAARAQAKSIGLGISLPFEQKNNDYISPNLSFEFHYFFMRKLWFLYHAKALIVFPGGFGTMDELFETLTLVQTRKLPKRIPFLLHDRAFWQELFNFETLVKRGLISPEDLNLISYFDTPEECIELLKPQLHEILNGHHLPSYNTGSSKVPPVK
jgi:uncharacterized protein (TIGR00730 family)